MSTALSAYNVDAVGCIQFEYGENSDKFGSCYYSIDTTANSIVWGELIDNDSTIIPTIEERLATLETQNTELKTQNLTLMDALATVYEAVANTSPTTSTT